MNQQVVSLASAESEFHAIGSGRVRGLTVKHVLQAILHTTSPDGDVKITICTDSDAPRGMIHRVGCGRVRHLQRRYFGISKRYVRDNSTWFAVARKRIRGILARRFWKERRSRAV